MSKIRSALLYVTAITVAAVTLQAVRKRRSKETEQAEENTDSDIHDDPETATDHAVAAVEHARVAASEAVETARESDVVETAREQRAA